jgi:multicomponent Na+:H+ antiporter subunit B
MMTKIQSVFNTLLTALVLLLLAIVLVMSIQFDRSPVHTAKNYCLENGSTETGAVNLVTAIYLEYRAFDTLGETIVLLLSVSGVLFFLERHHA